MRRALKFLAIGLGGTVALSGVFVALVLTGVVGPPQVPPETIASAVDHEPARLDEAFALPAASTYARELHWQTNGSLCGPASLVNVYRSLGETAENEGGVLDGSGYCGLGFCWMGLTLDQLAEVARSRGTHKVTVLRDLGPDEFREHLRLANDPARRYIVNFTRQAVFGMGGGHHSPIGGYLEAEDRVLVLDVNREFQPWLIEADRLYAAIDTLDGDHKRGLLLIE